MSTLALPASARAHNLALPLPTASPSTSQPNLPSTTITAPPPRQSLALPGMPPRSPSAELKDVEDDGEDEEGGDDDDDGKKKKSSGGGSGAGKGARKATEVKGEYKYTSEISQMMFVFGEVQDPLPETVRLVEDIVRGQIIEIITRARLLTHMRSSRFVSSEDLIFLIRDDRGKVNRLRTYLSWKDVRKKAKEDEEGDLDVDDAEKAAPKGRKSMVKLPWELLTPFGDFLRNLPSKQGRPEEEEEEDEDEMQAYQDSMQRLKDADEITKKMTRDEYVHYSDCRQASFTYRKARRFRDFVNFGAYLDSKPNDDIVDILGFLSFEMVRSLCVTALEVRDRMEKSIIVPRKSATTANPKSANATSPVKRKLPLPEPSPSKRSKTEGGTTTTGVVVASPEPVTPVPGASAIEHKEQREAQQGSARKATVSHSQGVSLFAAPPSARQPLLPAHVLEAFAQIQREQAASRTRGLNNFRGGGVGRGRVALV